MIVWIRDLAVTAGLNPVFSEKFLRFVIDEVIRHHKQAGYDQALTDLRVQLWVTHQLRTCIRASPTGRLNRAIHDPFKLSRLRAAL